MNLHLFKQNYFIFNLNINHNPNLNPNLNLNLNLNHLYFNHFSLILNY